jgi:DNA-binding CsgD family transcriptional regulator
MKRETGRSCHNPFDLTCGELRVLRMLVKGLRRGEISEQFEISLHTVDTHLARAYRKLGVHNEVAAVSKLLCERAFGLVQIRAGRGIGKDEKSMDPLIAQVNCPM